MVHDGGAYYKITPNPNPIINPQSTIYEEPTKNLLETADWLCCGRRKVLSSPSPTHNTTSQQFLSGFACSFAARTSNSTVYEDNKGTARSLAF